MDPDRDKDDEQTHGDDNRTPDTALEALEDVQHLGIVPPVVQSFYPDLPPTVDPTDETGTAERRPPSGEERD